MAVSTSENDPMDVLSPVNNDIDSGLPNQKSEASNLHLRICTFCHHKVSHYLTITGYLVPLGDLGKHYTRT